MKSKITNASILVTGANGGLGIETIKLLIKESPARIVMATRTIDKALDVKAWVESQGIGNVQLESAWGFDMTNGHSIQTAVKALPEGKPFDVVFLQAGGVFFTADYQFTKHRGQAIEKTIFQNAFGAYLTLIYLEQEGLLAEDARIVFAGGEGARGINGLIAKPEFKSFEELKSYMFHGGGSYNPMNAIGVSKLVSALLAIKLSENESEKEYLWFSPGLTSGTKGLNAMKGLRKHLMKHIAFPLFTFLGFAQSPRKAAVKYVDSLAGRIGTNGDVLGAPEGKALGNIVDQKPMNSAFTNFRLKDDLFAFVNDLLGVDHKEAA